MGWAQRANKKVIVGILVVVFVVGTLIATQLPKALTYYVTVEELRAKGDKAYDDQIRVSGYVQRGSVVRDAASNLSFTLYYGAANAIPIDYKGTVPDMFREEGEVVVEGTLKRDGIFYAHNLLAQHPPDFRIPDGMPTPRANPAS